MFQPEGVILAAGLSTRANRWKMALPLGDRTVLECAVASMAPFVERIIVVVGWQAELAAALLKPYPQVELVANPSYLEGMFSSVCAGLAHVRGMDVSLLPGDHPLVGADVYRRLLAASGPVRIPVYQGRKGHPLYLASECIPAILALPPVSSLRDYIRQQGFTAVDVADEGILLDVDTPADYDLVLSRYFAGSHPLPADTLPRQNGGAS